MKPAKFDYINPKTLDEALQALQIDDVKLIAGGQSLVPLMNYRLSQPSTIIDINSIKELSMIDVINETSEIGSSVTQTEASESRLRRQITCQQLTDGETYCSDSSQNHPELWYDRVRSISSSQMLRNAVGKFSVSKENQKAWKENRAAIVKAKEFFISELTTDLNQNEIIKSFSFPLINNRDRLLKKSLNVLEILL